MNSTTAEAIHQNITMAKKLAPEPPAEPEDPTAWILDNGFAEFVLMHTNEIKYMCMLGYTFMHGSKVFKALGDTPFAFKFVNMIMACTGGGILVPIFINAVPVPLCTDAYPIAILTSFALHTYFPILREVLALSPVFKGAVIILYETMRAFVVAKLTAAAGAAIPASEFSFPLFGPIFCGTIAGCGGAFLPLNKGLDPIKKGIAPPMFSAFIAATSFHLFLNLGADDVPNGVKKAKVAVAAWFILHAFYTNGLFPSLTSSSVKEEPKKADPAKVKKEN